MWSRQPRLPGQEELQESWVDGGQYVSQYGPVSFLQRAWSQKCRSSVLKEKYCNYAWFRAESVEYYQGYAYELYWAYFRRLKSIGYETEEAFHDDVSMTMELSTEEGKSASKSGGAPSPSYREFYHRLLEKSPSPEEAYFYDHCKWRFC